MSTLKADTVTTKSNDTDLTITGGGTGVPNLEAGFKVGGSAGVPTASIQDNAVTLAKMAGLTRGSIIHGDSSGDPAALAVGGANTVLQSDGTDASYGTVATAMIADDAVTLAKLASGTDGELITWDASGDPAAVAVGTATHVLTSNGAGAAPTFQAAAGGGGLQSVQVFTSSGTWTKPAGISSVRVQLVGSGCGGMYWNMAGGAGGYSEKFIDVSSIASETVTVGAGAASLAAGNTSSFGSHCSGAGGGLPPGSPGSRTLGGLGGTATGGDINIQGAGGAGMNTGTTSADGAPSYFGGGPAAVTTNPASPNNVTNGAYGSSGGTTSNGYSAMPASPSGIVIVWEYA
tara:strand:+ start:2898 stop:3935 length:1038 start_codon:yes stop_codon:yes gene_type:complete